MTDEGETLYNKAYKYEETGLSLYKDKATGRYYHMIICRLRHVLLQNVMRTLLIISFQLLWTVVTEKQLSSTRRL